MGDVGFSRGYRTKEELDAAWAAEPVGRFRARLLAEGLLPETELAAVEAEVEREMEAAIAFVHASPQPDVTTIWEEVYA
jgi:pyruvate dehydrogenase E1 component alpha subunit